MGNELTASYRLVYFQPDPEDGERVCVALLFNTQRDVELLYDSEFPKLRCLAPHIDTDLVKIYLDDMEANLKRAPSDVDLLIRRHSPQLVTSEARKAAWPLTNTARMHLMRRFLSKEGRVEDDSSKPLAKDKRVNQVKAHLRALVQRVAKEQIGELQEDAKAHWVLGQSFPGIDPIAFGLRRTDVVILIDGIDLSVLKPKPALSRANRITHTFWQYRNIRQMGFLDRVPHRIGVVLNGMVNPGVDYKDVHDFALHQFRNEADLAVDASSPDDLRKLEEMFR